MLKDGSRVRETTSTQGTGDLVLAGPKATFTSFASQVGDGNMCLYWLFDSNGLQWECGVGTVDANTLERTTLIESSTGSKISLSNGIHTVVNAPVPGFATGSVNFLEEAIFNVRLGKYRETAFSVAPSSETVTVDAALGSVCKVAVDRAITITPTCPNDGVYNLTLILTQVAPKNWQIAFDPSIEWEQGNLPDVSLTGKTVVTLFFDGDGWLGNFAGKDYAVSTIA